MSSSGVNDLEADKIRHIAAACMVAWDDQPQRAIWASRAKLSTGIGVGDKVGLIAECRIDFAQRDEDAVPIAAGGDDAIAQQVILDRWIRQKTCILNQGPERNALVCIGHLTGTRGIGRCFSCRLVQSRQRLRRDNAWVCYLSREREMIRNPARPRWP